MISNKIVRIDKDMIEIPVVIRDDQKGWVPTFDIWPTKIYEDTSYIDCTQTFGAKLKHYATTDIDPRIGHYNGKDLIIKWKLLVNTASLELINKIYNGKIRGTCWQGRYCTYFGKGSDMPWLHSAIVGDYMLGYVRHHANCVAVDDRLENLHILPKGEHDSINHPKLAERKQIFDDPRRHWSKERALLIEKFITELFLIAWWEEKADFIAKFAEGNMVLAKKILEMARLDINLSSVKNGVSENRILNPHLTTDYLDAYEMKKYLKMNEPKSKIKMKKMESQVRMFKQIV